MRESIQNAIDARDTSSSSPVKVKYTLGSVSHKTSSKYFENLYPRIDASLGKAKVPEEGICNFIAIEDFNTTGLLGSLSSDKPLSKTDTSFWYFAWASGASNKNDGTRGKNGVGKIVFPRSSAIKSQLVLSVRSRHPGLPKTLVFGTALLKLHDFESTRWAPECRWMTVDSNDEHIPFTDSVTSESFTADWGLKRKPNEAGTSIIVPFTDDSFSKDNLTQCIIQDYFVAILDGTIEAEVEDALGVSTLINASTIESLLSEIDEDLLTRSSKTKAELLALCDLYKKKVSEKTIVAQLLVPFENKGNKWEGYSIEEPQKLAVLEALDSGNAVEFEIDVLVPEKLEDKGIRAKDSFSVLFLKEEALSTMPTFAREGILIPSAASTSQKYKGLVTLVVVNSGDLADCLGQAEGPSHERWSAEESKFREKYVKSHGIELIKFMKDSANKIVRLIQSIEDETENTRYAKWFPTEEEKAGNTGDIGPVVRTKKKRKRKIGPITTKSPFAFEKVDSGFTVRLAEGASVSKKGRYVLKAGYTQISGGSPFKLNDDDFELKNMSFSQEGTDEWSWNKNHLTFTVKKDSFFITLTDFDKYRDLSVEVVSVS